MHCCQNFLYENLFSLYWTVFATFIQSILEYSVSINYTLITLFHYPCHWTDEPKLNAKHSAPLSRVPHNSCIQRRPRVSKIVRNEQAVRSKKIVLDCSGVASCVGNLFKSQERLACVRCLQYEDRG